MANLKSSKKDIRRTQKRTFRNNTTESKVRTFLKKAKSLLIDNGANVEQVQLAIIEFESVGMKAAGKGIISKKSVSRRVSLLIQAAKKRFAVM